MTAEQLPQPQDFPDVHRDIFNAVSENILFLGKDLRVQWANRASLRERGLPLEEIAGRFCYEVWHSRTSPCEACPAAQALASGHACSATVVFPDGIHRLVQQIPRTTDRKEITGLVEIVLDPAIEEWRTDLYFDENRYNSIRAEIWKAAADKSLAKEELIQRLISILGHFLNVSRASYYESGNEGDVVECKVQWCAAGLDRYVGDRIPSSIFYGTTSFFNADMARLNRDTIPEPVRAPLELYFDKHAIRSLLLVLFDRANRSFFSFSDCEREREWTETETALILEMMRIVRIRVDQLTTEQEKSVLEGQLRHAQTLEAIGQLAGGVAHDFNNILGAISGYAEMIRQKFSADNPKLEKYSSAILSSARRAAELTSQLLAFARKGKFQKTNLDIHELISHISLLLQHTLDEKTKLVFDLKAQNPFVFGDPTQVQNILLNLAMNARDAMPDGGTLMFATENSDLDDLLRKSHPEASSGPYVAICVSDTGVGMDENTKARLFEPFFTTKDIGQGSGLGLASVYGSVTSHNGYVGVNSEKGRGSAITVYFPVNLNAPAHVLGGVGPGVMSGTGTIVVIDNDEAIRSICREMLSAMGYTVTEFDTGVKAVAYYSRHPITEDLFIIDMIMQGMNGRECFRELLKINPRVKAILSSGYSFENDRAEIAAEGISGLLQKPFDTARLSQIVAQAIGKPSQQTPLSP